MNKVTLQEIEMLAALIQRATLNYYEATWANAIIARLRMEAGVPVKPPAGDPAPE